MENSSSSFLTVLVIIALYYSQPSFSSQNENYDRCSEAFICGASGEITYPFFDGETRPEYCGKPGFKVGCLNRQLTQINVSTQSYFLQNINYVGHTIVVNSTQIWDSHGCPRSTSRVTYTVDYSSIVNLTSSDEVLNFYYGCTADLNLDFPAIMTNCSGSESGPWVIGYYLLERNRHRDIHDQLMGICSGYAFIPIFKSWADLIDVTIDPNSAMKSVLDALRSGFELEMVAEVGVCEACIKSGGQCGTNLGSSKFVCYCPEDKDQDFICTTHPRKGSILHQMIWSVLIKVGVPIIAVGILANLVFGRLFYRFYKIWRIQRSFCSKRYSYSRIKKMTNSFKEKLGEGGYGPVFKGKLENGCLVAVKLWKQSSGDGQEFLNEVASISRTNHTNIVVLLGFCFEGPKQALIYEFMSNGSLEKFVHDNKNKEINRSLPMHILFQIGVGVARGLEYLHVGCDTRILHFDIKPHNILLDEEFNPKISDFGLARSCTRRKSTISMSAARGTAGYIAPEVFFRNYGRVSYKSDVYSYGMMLLEIIGQRKNENAGMEDNSSSELYFPQWIYTRLEQDQADVNFERDILSDEEEGEHQLERKMILVGLWCIQTNPLNRPSMSSVVQMLKGKLESLCVPPMPSLSSLPRLPIHEHQTDQYCSTQLSSLTL